MGDAVVCHCKWLDERGLVERNAAGGVYPTLFHNDVLSESTAAAGNPDESHLVTQVVVAAIAGGAGAVDHERLNNDVVTDVDPGHIRADLFNDTGKLVTHHHR